MVITFKSIARSLKQFPTRTFSNSSCAEMRLRVGSAVYTVCPSCPWLWPHSSAERFCWRDLVLGCACQVGRVSLAGGKGDAFGWKTKQMQFADFFFFLQPLQRITVENLVFTVQLKRGTVTFHHGGTISFLQVSVRETALLVSFKFFLSL